MTTQQITKQLDTISYKLDWLRTKIIQVPENNQQTRRRILLQTAGVLRKKMPKDSVAWQRKIRGEWDRRSQ